MNSLTETALPISVTFRNLKRSDWLEELIIKRSTRLQRFDDRITSCHVTVDMPHKKHHQGNFFRIRLEISVPGRKIVVSREPDEHNAFEDMNAVLKDVFESAARQVETCSQLRREQ